MGPSARVMLTLINQERRAHRLPGLRASIRLSRAALHHSKDMAGRNYFSHISPEGISPFTRMSRAGARYHAAGENIGYEYGLNRLVMLDAINAAMMRSRDHRDNILRSTFGRVGIGVAEVGGRLYVTEDFTG